jgi:hypothetical protein
MIYSHQICCSFEKGVRPQQKVEPAITAKSTKYGVDEEAWSCCDCMDESCSSSKEAAMFYLML